MLLELHRISHKYLLTDCTVSRFGTSGSIDSLLNMMVTYDKIKLLYTKNKITTTTLLIIPHIFRDVQSSEIGL
jgi:hypothetical protein